MIGSIAHLRGYDVDDRRVRAALTLAMLGDDEVRRLVSEGKLPTTPLVIATSPMFDPDLERKISERVMGSLAGRMGGKHLAVVVVRRIPLVGGGVGQGRAGHPGLVVLQGCHHALPPRAVLFEIPDHHLCPYF